MATVIDPNIHAKIMEQALIRELGYNLREKIEKEIEPYIDDLVTQAIQELKIGVHKMMDHSRLEEVVTVIIHDKRNKDGKDTHSNPGPTRHAGFR